jgi:hypothetical protein
VLIGRLIEEITRLRRWRLRVSHLETIVPFVLTPSGIVVPAQMPQAPRWSFNAIARYEWPMLGGQISLESDGKYRAGLLTGGHWMLFSTHGAIVRTKGGNLCGLES